MIEYIIREENLHEFLDTMAERRRVRRRDGARNWTLLRDVENPELWIESYHTPTWVEYIRHNRASPRPTPRSASKIRQLHSGAEPPRVHRMIERPTDWTASHGQLKGMIDLH